MSPFVVMAPPAHVQPAFAELTRPSVVARSAQAPFGWSVYVIRRGDTLSDLALRYKTTVGALVAKNHLRSRHADLTVGQRVAVPRLRPIRAAAVTTTQARRAADLRYVVRPGDTVAGIATRHRVAEAALLRANHLSRTSIIRPGQRLTVPGGLSTARQATKAARHRAANPDTLVVTVRPGDTVSMFAARYDVSRASIVKANGLGRDAIVRPGQRLRIVGALKTTPLGSAHPALSAAGRANLRYLNSHPAPSRSTVKAMIIRAARDHGVDRKLALAIGWQESRWSQRAVSEDNAIGVMQCLPSTGSWMSTVLSRRLNLLHAQDNITCGVGLLRTLHRSAEDEREVIAAYYQGLASVRTRGLYDDTKAYVASVLRHKARM